MIRIHPLLATRNRRLASISLLLTAVIILCMLLNTYGEASFRSACTGSIIYMGILAMTGFLYRYMFLWFTSIQLRIILTLAIQLISIGITALFLFITGWENPQSFLFQILLYVTFGTLCWIILIQWYLADQTITAEEEETEENKVTGEIIETKNTPPIENISVKNGSEIHIIRIENIYYLQAYGDYVILFTENGKHIKEQTMKYFELHLPMQFVRIHRSYIINTEYIIQIELFGKETYNIRLKNGVSLRASNNGYKLLKEKLYL